MAIVSDDFSSATLGGVWSFAGPSGTGTALRVSGGEAYLEFQVPNGDFDLYRQTKNALRVTQKAPDADFQVRARYLSTPTVKNQMQGILVEEDADSWIRFDTYFDGAKLRAFAAVTLNGATTNKINVVIDGAAPALRVTRTGDTWSFAHSTDGTTWKTTGTFTQALDVTAVGPFAGGLNSAYTARLDYFENTAAPILNEDGSVAPPVNTAPVAGDDTLVATAGTPLSVSIAGLLANDSDAQGSPLTLTSFTQPAHATLVNNGNGTLTYKPATGFVGPDSFIYTVSDGALSDTAKVSVTVAAPPPSTGIVSDDFSSATLGGVWSFAGPSGTGTALRVSGGEAYLEFQVPNGDFDLYRQTKNALRVTQKAPDADFQVRARYLSTPTVKNQMQGILVEEDADSWIRFDTYFDGAKLRAFAAVTLNGATTNKINVVIDGAAPALRVTRTGDTWSFAHSTDGTTWKTTGTFTQALDVTAVGPFAGGLNSAYTARLDYFENTAAPILNEDGALPQLPDLSIKADTAAQNEGNSGTTNYSFTVTRSGSDLGQPTTVNYSVIGSGAFPASAADFSGGVLPSGQVTFSSGQTSRKVTASVVGDTIPERDEGFAVVLSNPGNGRIVAGSAAATIVSDDAVLPPIIDVWYGDAQTFGEIGEAQRWVNVLGNVDVSQVTGLSYSLNGGASRTLSIGPDTRRLQKPGDFNIDIDYAALNGSAVDDVVTIRAQLASGGQVTRTVVIDYESGNRWTQNYSIDWAAVSDPQDVTQVIDGKWKATNAGLRVTEPGYDRFVAIGDKQWDNYELDLSITMHDLHSVDPRGRDGGAFAFGMRWNGHTDDPISGWQPKSGWNPSELIVYKTDSAGGYFYFFGQSGTTRFRLDEGETYNFTLRVEQVAALGHKYSLKVWDTDDPEPASWLFQRTITYTTPQTGSLFLLTHYYDVTFGDLTVTEIEGNDIVLATAAGGPLRAVKPGVATPGRGEVDVLRGATGADIFLLGENGAAFYDDGNAGSAGQGDYGVIWDFQKGVDRVQLGGTAGKYVLGSSPAGLPAGTAIYLDAAAGGVDELIGVVANTTGLSLSGSNFAYSTLAA